jgi:hypothetical protein
MKGKWTKMKEMGMKGKNGEQRNMGTGKERVR